MPNSLHHSSFRLRTWMMLGTLLLVMGTTLSLGLLVSQSASSALTAKEGMSLADAAFQMTDKLDRSMDSRIREVEILLAQPSEFLSGDTERIRTLLNNIQNSYDVASWLGFLDVNGNVVAASSGILEGTNIRHRPVFQFGQQGLWIGDVHEAVLLASLLPNPSGEPIKFVDIAAPVWLPDGRQAGVLAVHLSWEWANIVQRSIITPTQERQNLELFVVAQDGTVLLGPQHYIGQQLATSVTQPPMGRSWHILTWEDGISYVTGQALSNGEGRFAGLGWQVIARKPTSIALASVQEMQRHIILAGLVMLVAFALLGIYLSRQLTTPLTELTRAADRISGQSTPENIPIHTNYREVTQLGVALRNMVGRLNQQEQTIDQLTSRVYTDPLTRLPNRAFLDRHLGYLLPEAEREHRWVAMLYLDLDGFKQINDLLGHGVGDNVLIGVAERLRSALRGSDVGIRLGGDEFLVVAKIEPSEDLTALRDMGERLIAQIRHTVAEPNHEPMNLGCSVGIALWP